MKPLTTHEDFHIDSRTVTLPRHVFAAIADQLENYQAYAESMRDIGRGFYPSSPYGPETMLCILRSVLQPQQSQSLPAHLID